MNQSNPIHDNSVYSDPHPIQSTIHIIGKITKNYTVVGRWLNTHKMLSNTDIKRPLKYITQVFDLTSSNIKYVTARHNSFLLSLLGPSITKTSSIRRNPIQSNPSKFFQHSTQSNPTQSNPIQSMDASNPCPTLSPLVSGEGLGYESVSPTFKVWDV